MFECVANPYKSKQHMTPFHKRHCLHYLVSGRTTDSILYLKNPFLPPICPEPAPYHELDGEVGWRVRWDTYAGLSGRWMGHLLAGSSQRLQTPCTPTAGSSRTTLPMGPQGLTGLSSRSGSSINSLGDAGPFLNLATRLSHGVILVHVSWGCRGI